MNCAPYQQHVLTNSLSLEFTFTSCRQRVGGLAGNFVTLRSRWRVFDDRGRDPVMHMAPAHRQQLPSLRPANMTLGVRGRFRKKRCSSVQHSGQDLARLSVLVPSSFFQAPICFFSPFCKHGAYSQQQKAYALVLVMSCQLVELV